MGYIAIKRICMLHGIYEGSYCKKCKGVDDRQYNSTKRNNDLATVYNRKAWKMVRMQALVRDDFMCVHCRLRGVDTIATEVDHIIEIQDDVTLAYELSNLQSLCRSCHMKKTAKEVKKRGVE